MTAPRIVVEERRLVPFAHEWEGPLEIGREFTRSGELYRVVLLEFGLRDVWVEVERVPRESRR